MAKQKKLDREFYARDAETVARELLGCHLVRHNQNRDYVCRIVETEAYLGLKDLASHASRGRTPRNAIMFGPAGIVYVYFIYGMYEMFNIVTGQPADDPQAVLIRAAEPILPIDFDLSGPGKLTRAFGIDRKDYGYDLCTGPSLFFTTGTPPKKIMRAKRIGVDYAKHWKDRFLRFYDAESTCVSKR